MKEEIDISRYNSSSAYRLDEQQLKTTRTQPKPAASLRVVKQTKQETIADKITFKTVFMFVFIVGIICLMLYNQAQINEVNDRISKVQSNIQQLENEYVQMHSSLESSISLRNVALKAEQELGLERLDQYKTVHLRIYEQDQVELIETEEGESFSEQVETFVASMVQRIKGDV